MAEFLSSAKCIEFINRGDKSIDFGVGSWPVKITAMSTKHRINRTIKGWRMAVAQLWIVKPTVISRLLVMFLVAALFGLAGCQSGVTNIPVSPNSETGQAIRRMDYMAAHGGLKPEEEPSYRETAMQFIRYAQAGDVQQMLAMTSSHSYATQSDSVRIVYAEQVVPQFQGTTVTWASKGALCRDELQNPGLMFTGTVHGKKTYSFDVVIYKEYGKLVVANIRKHH